VWQPPDLTLLLRPRPICLFWRESSAPPYFSIYVFSLTRFPPSAAGELMSSLIAFSQSLPHWHPSGGMCCYTSLFPRFSALTSCLYRRPLRPYYPHQINCGPSPTSFLFWWYDLSDSHSRGPSNFSDFCCSILFHSFTSESRSGSFGPPTFALRLLVSTSSVSPASLCLVFLYLFYFYVQKF